MKPAKKLLFIIIILASLFTPAATTAEKADRSRSVSVLAENEEAAEYSDLKPQIKRPKSILIIKAI